MSTPHGTFGWNSLFSDFRLLRKYLGHGFGFQQAFYVPSTRRKGAGVVMLRRANSPWEIRSSLRLSYKASRPKRKRETEQLLRSQWHMRMILAKLNLETDEYPIFVLAISSGCLIWVNQATFSLFCQCSVKLLKRICWKNLTTMCRA